MENALQNVMYSSSYHPSCKNRHFLTLYFRAYCVSTYVKYIKTAFVSENVRAYTHRINKVEHRHNKWGRYNNCSYYPHVSTKMWAFLRFFFLGKIRDAFIIFIISQVYVKALSLFREKTLSRNDRKKDTSRLKPYTFFNISQ